MVRLTEEVTKHFIEFFHSFPCLWNVETSTYHQRDLRNAAMRKIAAVMQQECDELMTGEHAKL